MQWRGNRSRNRVKRTRMMWNKSVDNLGFFAINTCHVINAQVYTILIRISIHMVASAMLKAVYPRRYAENIMYDIILYNLISLALLCVLILELFVTNIKAVEGSGSKGTSKYVGEGVTYGVFLVIFLYARAY